MSNRFELRKHVAIVAERQQRTITINDVARAAGVSKATASVALNTGSGPGATVRVASETRLRIRKVAEELGYSKSGLALALSSGRTYTVGLVSQLDSLTGNIHSFNAYQKDIVIAVTCACARAGLRMTTILVNTPGMTTAADVADGRVDGAILASIRDDGLGEQIFKRGFPAVSIGSGYAERRVWPDNHGGMRQAVEHLYALGHRRILYVGYPLDGEGHWTKLQRVAGYEDALSALGLPAQSGDVRELTAIFDTAPDARPTACVCFNDLIASDVLRWARHRGISVPNELSVVGFDDSAIARDADPRLTTIENPIDAQAETAVSLLQALWRHEPVVSPPPMPTRLIVRESTAAAPVNQRSLPV
jgi:DNA-binding LacI/PurR family transcriptional regulator